MLLQNKNYNKVNATLDNRNQKPIFLFYIKKKKLDINKLV